MENLTSETFIEKSEKLNYTLTNVLNTLNNMDLPELPRSQDYLDSFLDATTKAENYVVDSKPSQFINTKANTLLDDIGTYSMIFAIPAAAFAIATGGLFGLAIAPILLIGGGAMKVVANRKSSITKTISEVTKSSIKATKAKAKDYVQDRHLQKFIENINEEKRNKKGDLIKPKNSEYRNSCAFIMDRVISNINSINRKNRNIAKIISEDNSFSKETEVNLLQQDAMLTILKIIKDVNNLKSIQKSYSELDSKIIPFISLCENSVNAIAESFNITNEMLQDKILEIKASKDKEEDPSLVNDEIKDKDDEKQK